MTLTWSLIQSCAAPGFIIYKQRRGCLHVSHRCSSLTIKFHILDGANNKLLFPFRPTTCSRSFKPETDDYWTPPDKNLFLFVSFSDITICKSNSLFSVTCWYLSASHTNVTLKTCSYTRLHSYPSWSIFTTWRRQSGQTVQIIYVEYVIYTL